jgi:hypothetical protein
VQKRHTTKGNQDEQSQQAAIDYEQAGNHNEYSRIICQTPSAQHVFRPDLRDRAAMAPWLQGSGEDIPWFTFGHYWRR